VKTLSGYDCVFCGSSNIVACELEAELEHPTILGVKIKAEKCADCGESYINGNEMSLIELIQKTLDEATKGA
jgi:transcription elongation factor Elf1